MGSRGGRDNEEGLRWDGSPAQGTAAPDEKSQDSGPEKVSDSHSGRRGLLCWGHGETMAGGGGGGHPSFMPVGLSGHRRS